MPPSRTAPVTPSRALRRRPLPFAGGAAGAATGTAAAAGGTARQASGDGATCRVAAAERAHEQHLRVENAGTQIDREAALREHVGLGIEDGEIRGEAGTIALHRHVVGGFGRRQGVALLALL